MALLSHEGCSSNAIFINDKIGKANLAGSNLSNASLRGANLFGICLREANLREAYLIDAILIDTDLSGADLSGADLYQANLQEASLKSANLVGALLVETNLYLLLNNQKIRDVINTITTKVVLILGRFTPQRKVVLDALRNELRKKNYLPVVFDFEKPARRDLTETISTLAHMARFVIADITQAKSNSQELERIVPGLPSVPVQPLLQTKAKEYGMFEHFKRYPWVLETYRYTTVDRLLSSLEEKVIAPAEQKAQELEKR